MPAAFAYTFKVFEQTPVSGGMVAFNDYLRCVLVFAFIYSTTEMIADILLEVAGETYIFRVQFAVASALATWSDERGTGSLDGVLAGGAAGSVPGVDCLRP